MNISFLYKYFLRPVVLFWVALAFCGQFLQAQPGTDNIKQLQFSDTLIMGVDPNYPPYSIVDENGNVTGFSVDIFKAAAAAAGFEVIPEIGFWTDIRNDLVEGNVDALPIMGRTPERESIYDFSLAYLSLNGAVFVRKGENKMKSFEDLRNKEILVMKSDNAEEFVRREKITDKIFTTTTIQEAFLNLESGQHDAVLIQHITGLSVLKELGISSVKALDIKIPRFRVDYCFAVNKGNSELLVRLNEGLSIVISDGTYRDIYYKYFGPEEMISGNMRNLGKILLFILIPVILALVVAWIYLLRTQVNKRTERLNKEIEEHKNTLKSLEQQQKMYKKSEEQIRLLLNSTAEGIYGLDTSGNCTLINRAALQVLGYSSPDEVLGKNMHHLIHHTKADGSVCNMEECEIYYAFRKGVGVHNDDEIFWKANGSSFPVEYFSHPVIKNGIVTGSVVTFWDITQRKKAENELIHLKNDLEMEVNQRTTELADKVKKLDRSQKAMLYMVEDLNQITAELKTERAKLEMANTELEAFTYSVSHDLRAPLRAINGYSGFLLEDYGEKINDDGKQLINTIRENAAKMDRLITDLLNLSRVSRANPNFSDVDMKQLAQAILHETATEQEKNDFEITIEEMPVIKCDNGLMKQVWFNVLGNALKYSSRSERKKIEAGAVEKENEVTFFVRDYGAGFDEKFKDKIFNVFQRLHRENEYQGTGVGLTIVQRIIKHHGGKVWAESKLGKGATFYFTLPRRQKS